MGSNESEFGANETNEKSSALNLIINKLGKHPEYLLMIAVGLLGGGLGLGTTVVGLAKSDNTLTMLGFVSWVLLLLVSFLVIKYVKKESDRDSSQMGPTLGGKAQEAFFSGGKGETLTGRWNVNWFYYDKEGKRIPYDPDPQEHIDIMAHQSKVTGISFDPTLKQTYWLEGRLSDRNKLSLIYWSAKEKKFSGLTGTVFLEVDESFDRYGKKMSGFWHGFTRDNTITKGEVEWIKLG